MSARITEIAVSCLDPDALAEFWTAALGYAVGEREDGYVELVPPPGLGPAAPTIGLQRIPEVKTTRNRLHLDLSATDGTQEEEVGRLLALGARRTDADTDGGSWVVLADPEGNEFCVLRSRATPLA